jgi:hypothetical protein
VEKAKQKGEGGGLVLEKAIVELAQAFKDILKQFGTAFDQLCDVVMQHEQRLQALEGSGDLRSELKAVARRIEDLKDTKTREEASAEFAILCHICGVEDLEE